MDIELICLLSMLAVFLLANMLLKLPVSISMVLGAITGALVGGEGVPIRHLFEGTFTYLDTVLIIATAMIFMTVIQKSGALDALGSLIVTTFYKVPAIMLILLMFIVLFPGMVTGSSTAGVLTAGAIVAPIFEKIGIPKKKIGAIVAVGAILGMAAPPVNIPALLIAGGVDMPYIGFEAPLFFIVVPMAIFTVLILGLPYCKKIDIEAIKGDLDLETGKKYGFKLYLPIIVLAILLIACRVFPNMLPNLGMPLTFLISAAIGLFTGKKIKLLESCREGVKTTIPVLAKLMGVGMFIQVMTLVGARGWIVVSCLELPTILLIIAICIVCPLFGAVSSYGSASVLGVPFLLALIQLFPDKAQVVMAAALSCIVCMGDLMPPTAIAGNYAAALVGEKYSGVFKKTLIPFAVIVLFSIATLLLSNSITSFLG